MSATAKPFAVLLIEDSAADASLIKWALKSNHIPVDLYCVCDGYEALEFLLRTTPYFQDSPYPDLILIDLNMPRMPGLECLGTIKQDPSLCNIPVVVLSTSINQNDRANSITLGAIDYFVKPMDILQFVKTIRELGERWILPALSRAAIKGGNP